MHGHRKVSAAAQRFAARRQREDDAPRLSQELPELTTLKLAVEERTATGVISAPRHLRHIVVQSAPALFFLPCGDPRCLDGGHEITHEVMTALRHGDTTFEGRSPCHGMVGDSPCSRIMSYVGTAEYK